MAGPEDRKDFCEVLVHHDADVRWESEELERSPGHGGHCPLLQQAHLGSVHDHQTEEEEGEGRSDRKLGCDVREVEIDSSGGYDESRE